MRKNEVLEVFLGGNFHKSNRLCCVSLGQLVSALRCRQRRCCCLKMSATACKLAQSFFRAPETFETVYP
eukprot:4226835-Amphidinium_carterae.1